jgi:hypothetical protein
MLIEEEEEEEEVHNYLLILFLCNTDDKSYLLRKDSWNSNTCINLFTKIAQN